MIKKLDIIHYSSICTILPTLFVFKLSLGVLNNTLLIIPLSYSIILLPKDLQNYFQNMKIFFSKYFLFFYLLWQHEDGAQDVKLNQIYILY